MPTNASAGEFLERLRPLGSAPKRKRYERYLRANASEEFLGVRMREVFELAKEFVDMSPPEIEKLLESPIHEARVGAVSIMDKQARRKRTTADLREEIYRLYLRRSDRIDNWDLVDLGAPHVIGRYLYDKPRTPLYELARSDNPCERRTAIVSTLYFTRNGEAAETFKLAQILLGDEDELVQKPVGSLLREAGKVDGEGLESFLEQHAERMPRPVLRTATEKLAKEQRDRYLSPRQTRRKETK
jgi:3-methyladenine DNA glycosylase AlkD